MAKRNRKSVSVYLSPEDYEELVEISSEEMRAPGVQLLFWATKEWLATRQRRIELNSEAQSEEDSQLQPEELAS